MNQDESPTALFPGATSVFIGSAPRTQPYIESMDSLGEAIQTAVATGMSIDHRRVSRGVPGFQSAGPLLKQFLETSATHLFLAGDDILYPKNILIRLTAADKDVICGVYRKNNLFKFELANYEPTVELQMQHLAEGGIYPTDFCAGHTMTIRRRVIETMVRDYKDLEFSDAAGNVFPNLFLPIVKDGVAYQDDWAFSIRACLSGFELWQDYGCRCRHFCGDFLGVDQ